jgi:RNA polymerase sigma factor (sigma-70 family)
MGNGQVIDAGWAFAMGPMMRQPATHPKPRAVPALPLAADAAADPCRASLCPLVDRMVARDEGALGEFYDATVSKAYGLTLRIVRNAAVAEEVVGDAFHQVWRDAAHYDSARGGPLTWLLMICRSRALDALRARDPAVAHEAPDTLIPEADQPHDEDPIDLLTAMESRRRVHDALGVLSPPQRQMIGLAFFRGLSHQEIADATQVPLGTVKSQIRRALVALRAKLAAD